jgi:acetyltransferase-like isoleucine patch superfamily enzyme
MSTPDSSFSLLDRLLTPWKLRRCAQAGGGALVLGRVWIRGKGKVRIGEGVVLDGRYVPIELHALEPASEIVLGDGVRVDGGVSIEAVVSVRIGARTRLGAFSKVIDNHFHPLLGNRHARPPSVPVVVGADAEIGPRAVLLAGVQVGDGATVGPASVITRRTAVPPGRTARGMPAVLA